MRQIKIANARILTNEVRNLLATAEAKRLPEEKEQQLLIEIRKGNKEAIEALVQSWETVIIKLALQYTDTNSHLNRFVEVGRQALIKLAEQEIGSTSRERFFRFGAWCVKQAIFEEVSKGE